MSGSGDLCALSFLCAAFCVCLSSGAPRFESRELNTGKFLDWACVCVLHTGRWFHSCTFRVLLSFLLLQRDQITSVVRGKRRSRSWELI
jgi:hypothetical protein